MAQETQYRPQVNQLLMQLRTKIRRYVWTEGMAVVLVWAVMTFWIGLALDFIPVRLGAEEMPKQARVVLLVAISVTLLIVFYRWVFRRTQTRLKDRNLAVLIERRFPEFQESLLTSVKQSSSVDTPLQQRMLETAVARAERCASAVNVDEVFNFKRLRWWCAAAIAAASSVLLLAIFAWPVFSMAVTRLYGMSSSTYPRHTYLEMVDFEDGVVTVARGSNVTVKVQADASRNTPPPRVCTIYYETDNGERGSVNMNKKGAARDGWQLYTLDSRPFKSILSDVRFDVVGSDFRIRDQQIRTVESPQVVNVEVTCHKPDYTKLATTTSTYYPGIKFPKGSLLQLKISSNKPLVTAQIQDMVGTMDSEESLARRSLVPTESPNTVEFEIPQLKDNLRLGIELQDTDGVASQKPHVLSFVAVTDNSPDVMVRLTGIGTAITPIARLPMEGQITDDYGIDQTWFELELADQSQRSFPIQESEVTESMAADLDLRRQRADQQQPLELTEGARVVLSVRASDFYDLGDHANVGQSDRYELQVVSPNQLIALLEARELGLRNRFEQIILDFRESRNSLQQIELRDDGAANEPSLSLEPEQDPIIDGDSATRAAAVRSLRVVRAQQHGQRAAQEVLGVAMSFEDIRQEIINNRIDVNDRRDRIQRQIAQPLRQIGEELFPILDKRLVQLAGCLEQRVDEPELSASTAAALAQADEILFAMEAVLEKMLELETYNQLVDMLRSLIKDQEDLNDRTKKQQKKAALDLLK